ncbi:hypothetical protein MJO28_012118 [Puccinia striiformis f. sp. tritici]|uniref:Uncharacterized protein n=3 Tax=Puccinia striiformis TaxID=27350 RepID=A0A0L0V931_9BASI|nr:hypothetical protein Pst134EA_023001 [Puccinia striiformis f. sp. tritici]XP_047801752.1 hypothetical protein Pst134EA_023009 [Puccinia striiformis f. sp. tritici]KAI9606126.1 hypothetical protein H4Q26_004500 [Puccinia striiformis f. sp. tritici PST-130]KNE95793.1 hypothetical protein PSTG_10854 [Puccinia striiformis f. sp. tritici PST-78]POW01218.1 hypothetical protein PSTT_12627 [Puccinia striiformis]KAH9446031.1 hypothetical protein Pst134EB_023851 [Puccinia striiformis f. sp. tritici]
MLFLVVLLFIHAITALHIPHNTPERPLPPHLNQTVAETRLDPVNTITANGHHVTGDSKEVDSKEGLIGVSMAARAHPWNINRAYRNERGLINLSRVARAHPWNVDRAHRHEQGLINLSMVARAHPWNIDRARRYEDTQESQKEERSKLKRRTG